MHNLEMVNIESPRVREIQNTIKDKDIKNKYKFIEAFMELILHICVHLTLLSLLEPILFFNYVIGMEKELFFDQIKSLVNFLTHYFKHDKAQEIRSETFFTLFIEFLKYEDVSIDNTIEDLRQNSDVKADQNDEYNDKLHDKAFMFFYIMLTITCSYYFIFQLIFRKKFLFFKVVGKHLALMIFVSLYEVWFFLNIIYKYRPWAIEEMTLFITECFFNRLFKYYPELEFMEQNVTATCDF